jgi:hypothetical protein
MSPRPSRLRLPMRLFAIAMPMILLLSSPAAWATEKDGRPYNVTVWALVVFGSDGKASDVDVAEASGYPQPFVARVRERLANARIQPPLDQGRPATFKTGVRVEFEITPGQTGGSARILGLHISPLPTKTYFASYPDDVAQTGGWTGAVQATCKVALDGRCSSIETVALPGIPESVRRFARASLEGWSFMPQEVNGQPVEGEYKFLLQLSTLDSAPEDFRVPKFQRATQGR